MTQAEDGRTGRPGAADETMPPEDGRRQWSVPTDPIPSGSTPATGATAPSGGGRRRLLIILGALIAALILVIAAVVLLRDTEPAPQAPEANPNGWGDPAAAEYLEPPFQSGGDRRSADYPKWDLLAEGLSANQATPRDTAVAVNGAFREAMWEAADNAAPGDPMPERLEGLVTDDGDEFECRISSADERTAWWECRGPATPEGIGLQVYLSPQPQGVPHGRLIPGDADWADYIKRFWAE